MVLIVEPFEQFTFRTKQTLQGEVCDVQVLPLTSVVPGTLQVLFEYAQRK